MSYIKLHRKFLKWEWYNDINTKILFIHLLLKANWKDAKFEGKIIKRGSLVTSLQTLSDELSANKAKFNIQSVRTALKHLISTKAITIETTNKYTVITINNYEQYQDANTVDNKQLTNNQQTTNKQLTTIEEIEEYKNNNIFNNNYSLYEFVEKEFGRTLSPVEYQTLLDWEETYGEEKTKLAFREAILNDVRNFKYTQAILDNWKNLTIKEIKSKNSKQKKEIQEIEFPDYNWLEEQ